MHTWEDPEICQIWTVNQANQSDWLKGTWKKYIRKVIKTATRVQTQRLSLSSPVCLSTCTVLFFLLTNTSLISLLSVFVGILFCIAKGPGLLLLTTDLVARIWCFHHCNPAPVSSWERKPHSKPLQAEATGDQTQITALAILICQL